MKTQLTISEMSIITAKVLNNVGLRQRLVWSPRFIGHRGYADEIHPGYAKFRRTQARFQVEDGCPIHLKKGWSDRLLYWTTMMLCGVGMVMNFKSYYEFIYPDQEQAGDNKQ